MLLFCNSFSSYSSCNKSRIRHRSSDVDQATISWIEMGLERVHSEEDIRINALRKWHGFLKQHVMQTLEQVRFFLFLHTALQGVSFEMQGCEKDFKEKSMTA